jgi:hypothetical protein
MNPAKRTGRIVGLLLFVHLATGLMVPYIILRPLTVVPLGFLENAAGMSFQVRLSVLILFVGGAVTVGIAVATLPVFRRYSGALALWLLALAVVNFSLQAVENATWLSMLSLSQEYAKAGAADAGLFRGLGAVVRAAWKWTHYSHLFVVGSWIFVFYSVLWRSALVPRALAAAGLLTAMLQITCITLPQFLGYPSVMPIATGLPLGVSYIALALWLLVKGFEERRSPLHAEAQAVELAGA